MDGIDIDVHESDSDMEDVTRSSDVSSSRDAPTAVKVVTESVLCGRCNTANCMEPHITECDAPLRKFIVCVKCQCLCLTVASYLAHVRECLGATPERAPNYVNHIVCFEEAPELGICQFCGVFRQRQGVLLEAHRHICGLYVREHQGDKFPFLPGEIAWSPVPGTIAPPVYFTSMMEQMAKGEKWSVVEERFLARLDLAASWRQLPCAATRGGAARAPVFAGKTMYHHAFDRAQVRTDAAHDSDTSEATTATEQSSAGAHTSSVEDVSVEAAVQQIAHRRTTSSPPAEITVSIGNVASLETHITPSRQQDLQEAARVRRGNRAGRGGRGTRRRHARQSDVTSSAASSAATSDHSLNRDGPTPARNRRSEPLPSASTPLATANAAHNVAPGRPRRHRPLRNGGGGPGHGRVVNNADDGTLRVTSSLQDSGFELEPGRGTSLQPSPPPPYRSHHSSPAPPMRRRHMYMEAALHDHRTGLFVASMLVCGTPATGTSPVVRRDQSTTNYTVSFYPLRHGFDHLAELTVNQIRAQAFAFDTATKRPAGTFIFWERPPTRGEWLLRARDDAVANPDSDFVRLKFSPLKRG